MMKPLVIIVAEDNVERIENMLEVFSDSSELNESIKQEAANIVTNHRDYKENNIELGLSLDGCINLEFVKIIWPPNEANFKTIEMILNGCSNQPAVCFLDLALDSPNLDQLIDADDQFSVGIFIGEKFGAGFGRLLVQASSKAPGYRRGISGKHVFSPLCWPDSEEGARELLETSLVEFSRRYTMHAVPEIAGFLWHILCGHIGKWDSGFHPFHHDNLESRNGQITTHLNKLAEYLNVDVQTLNDNKNGWNPAKGLFEMTENGSKYLLLTSDLRKISNDALTAVLRKLNITAQLSLDGPEEWRLPLKPALPFLMALRAFIAECEKDGRVPPAVSLLGQKKRLDNKEFFCGEICFNFAESDEECRLISRYHEKLAGNDGNPVGGLSEAFYNLLHAKISLNHSVEVLDWHNVFTMGLAEGLMYEPKEKNSNVIKVKWEVR